MLTSPVRMWALFTDFPFVVFGGLFFFSISIGVHYYGPFSVAMIDCLRLVISKEERFVLAHNSRVCYGRWTALVPSTLSSAHRGRWERNMDVRLLHPASLSCDL